MKRIDVKIGGTYLMKVSGKLAHVRIEHATSYGGWEGKNIRTGRTVFIRSPRKLRSRVDTPEVPND